MSNLRKAFVLMPFKEPYDSYYPAILKPGLQAAGFEEVSRADDVFTPRPVILDIQQSIVGADLILSDLSERNPNVFYELGLAHAIGRPAILIAREQDDIPFNLRHIRVIVYDYTRAGWEDKLRSEITEAAKSLHDNTQVWPPPLVGGADDLTPIRALAHEIAFNLQELDRFLSRDYSVVDKTIMAKGKSNVVFRYATCMTSMFDSVDVQTVLSLIEESVRQQLHRVYGGFRQINDRADALKRAFRPWRAAQYIDAVTSFQETLRASAEQLQVGLPRVGRGTA